MEIYDNSMSHTSKMLNEKMSSKYTLNKLNNVKMGDDNLGNEELIMESDDDADSAQIFEDTHN